MARGLHRLAWVLSALLLSRSLAQAQAPATEQHRVRTDLAGDPLPDGAVCRLGTYRFRHPERVSALQFSLDGQRLVSVSECTVCSWEVPSGKLRARFPVLGGQDEKAAGFCAAPERPGNLMWGPPPEPLLLLSPDARILAREAKTGVDLIDTATGKTVASAPRFSWPVGLTAGGKILTALDAHLTVWQWDVPGKKKMRAAKLQSAHGGQPVPSGMICSGDGNTLASARASIGIRRWDVTTGKELLPLRGHGKRVIALAWSGDGRSLASLGLDGTVRLWDADGNEVRRWPTPPVYRPVLALSHDGKALALAAISARGSFLRLCDTATGKDRHLFEGRPHIDSLSCLAFSHAGQEIAAANTLGEITRWALDTGKAVGAGEAAPRTAGGHLIYTRDGKGLFAGHLSRTALWDLAAGRPARTFAGSVPWDLAPGGKHLATLEVAELPAGWDLDESGPLGFRLRVVPVGGGKPRWETLLASLSYERAAFSADGRGVVVCRAQTRVGLPHAVTVEVLGADGGKRLAGWGREEAFPHPRPLAADRKRVALLTQQGEIELRHLTAGKPAVTCAAVEGITEESRFGYSPDGTVLAGVTSPADEEDIATAIWDTATGKLLRRLPGRALGWAPDSKAVLLTADGRLGLWSVATGRQVRDFPRAGGAGRAALSPDGRYVAVVPDAVTHWRFGAGEYTGPRRVTLLETATGAPVRTFEGHQKAVYTIVFGSDSRTVATASLDGTALVWDVTGRLERGRVAPAEQSAEEFDRRWEALRSADARGHRAVWELVAAGDGAVRRLRGRLAAVRPVEPARLAKLLAALSSKSFQERQRAAQELLTLDAARPELRKALAGGDLSLEARRRLEGILEGLADPAAGPERLRAWRTVQALEQIDTPRAGEALEALAAGAPAAHLTEQARQALGRLAALRTTS